MSLILLKIVAVAVKQNAKPIARNISQLAREDNVLRRVMLSAAHLIHRRCVLCATTAEIRRCSSVVDGVYL